LSDAESGFRRRNPGETCCKIRCDFQPWSSLFPSSCCGSPHASGPCFSATRRLEEGDREDFKIIQGATLTLLALLLGFSFSMAITCYDQRKDYEEAEANEIGTEYLRPDLLPADDAAKVRDLLKNYLAQRILFYRTRNPEELRAINERTANLQTVLSSAVRAPAAVHPTTIPLSPFPA
jgi:hypothetical protein